MATKDNLLYGTKLSTGLPILGTAAATSRNGAILDMSGYEGVLMILQVGVMNSSAVNDLHAEQDTAVGMGGAADLLGTAIAIADDDDGQIMALDIWRPLERYVRGVVTKNGAQTSDEALIYLQYGAHVQPTTNNVTNLVTVELHQSPAEGTK